MDNIRLIDNYLKTITTSKQAARIVNRNKRYADWCRSIGFNHAALELGFIEDMLTEHIKELEQQDDYSVPKDIDTNMFNGPECPNCGRHSLKQSAKVDWCDECGYSQGYP